MTQRHYPVPASDRLDSLAVFVSDYAAAGASDSTTGIAAAFTAAAAVSITTVPDAYDGTTAYTRRPRVVFGRGLWNVTSTITIPAGVDVEIDDDAVVKAASVSTMGPVFDTTLNAIHQKGRIVCRGTIHCNNKASSGIYLRSFAAFDICTPEIVNPTTHGIILGDPSSTSRPYGATVTSPVIWRPNGATVPSASTGVYLQNVTDSHIGGDGSTIYGFDYGVRNGAAGGNNSFHSIHVWGYPANSDNSFNTALLPSIAFLDDATASIYIGCYADTPNTYGWNFTADNPGSQMVACRGYLNSAVTDNTVTIVRFDCATTSSVTVAGLIIACESGHRAATDYGGNLVGTVRVGTQNINVAAPVGDALGVSVEQLYPDLHDRFIGTDGSAASSTRWTTSTGGAAAAAAVLNSNRLRLTTGATGSYSTNDRVSVAGVLGANIADADLLALVEFGNPTVEGYLYLGVRASAAAITAGSGYAVQIGAGATPFIGVNKYVSGTQTGLYFDNTVGFSAGDKRWFRIRVKGTTLSMWTWPYGLGQPTTPTFAATDSSVSAAGLMVISGYGGAAATSAVNYIRQADVFVLQ